MLTLESRLELIRITFKAIMDYKVNERCNLKYHERLIRD